MCFGCLGVREVLAVLRREDATLTQLDAFVHFTYLLNGYFSPYHFSLHPPPDYTPNIAAMEHNEDGFIIDDHRVSHI